MKPIFAILKHDIENFTHCYRFEIHFDEGIKTLIINLNENKKLAYFVDAKEPSNVFHSDWVQELIHNFKNQKPNSDYRYSFHTRTCESPSPSLFRRIISSSALNTPNTSTRNSPYLPSDENDLSNSRFGF